MTTPFDNAAVYALTQQGAMLGESIVSSMGGDLFVPNSVKGIEGTKPFNSLRELVAANFSKYRNHIFVSAVGIAVRCIAPYIRHKVNDPTVIALDQRGHFVVSLLSGHLGGANNLAWEVASIVGGTAVITTATDTEQMPSIDMLAMEQGLTVANLKASTCINAAILAGTPVLLHDPDNHLQLKSSAWSDMFLHTNSRARIEKATTQNSPPPIVEVTCRYRTAGAHHLVLHPRSLHIGIGCKRGTPGSEIRRFIQETLAQLELAEASIECIASINLKHDEAGLWEAASALNVPLRFFSQAELAKIPLSSPSSATRDGLGNDGVCEAAALFAAGTNATLLLPKRTDQGMALALAQEAPIYVCPIPQV